MGFGAPAALGAKVAARIASSYRWSEMGASVKIHLFSRPPLRRDIAVVWIVMNNRAFGTIAGLQKAHFGTTFGNVFREGWCPYSADFAAIAKAYGVEGVRIESADQFKPALEAAIEEQSAGRARRHYGKCSGPDNGPLEHHGHLLARQRGYSRRHLSCVGKMGRSRESASSLKCL